MRSRHIIKTSSLSWTGTNHYKSIAKHTPVVIGNSPMECNRKTHNQRNNNGKYVDCWLRTCIAEMIKVTEAKCCILIVIPETTNTIEYLGK